MKIDHCEPTTIMSTTKVYESNKNKNKRERGRERKLIMLNSVLKHLNIIIILKQTTQNTKLTGKPEPDIT